jgi:EpsI family protein
MKVSWRFLTTAALLAATLAAASITTNRAPEALAQPLETIPQQIGPWASYENPPLNAETEAVLKATSYLSRTYVREGERVDFFTAFYALQEAGESMHSPKNCLPGGGWEIWRHGSVEVPVEGTAVTINQYGIQNGSNRMVVLYWYQTPERVIASEYFAKLCLVWDAVMRGHTSGSIVRLTVPDRPGAAEAALELAAELIPEVQKVLPEAG